MSKPIQIQLDLSKENVTKIITRTAVNLEIISRLLKGLGEARAKKDGNPDTIMAGMAMEAAYVMLTGIYEQELGLKGEDFDAEVLKYIKEVEFEFGEKSDKEKIN